MEMLRPRLIEAVHIWSLQLYIVQPADAASMMLSRDNQNLIMSINNRIFIIKLNCQDMQ